MLTLERRNDKVNDISFQVKKLEKEGRKEGRRKEGNGVEGNDKDQNLLKQERKKKLRTNKAKSLFFKKISRNS